MKALLLCAAMSLCMTVSSHAQTATSQSGAASQSQSSANVQAGAASNSAIVFNTPSETVQTNRGRVVQEYRGDYTVRSAPGILAPSMSSGHPCGLGSSVGISIIGGGGAGGNTRSDDACLLAQMGDTQAARIMIASRNPSACRALIASGQISAQSYCGRGRSHIAPASASASVPATSPRPAAATRTIPAGSVTCGNPIRVRPGVDHELARAYCRQQ